jgi:type IV pilus assembly protein PilE
MRKQISRITINNTSSRRAVRSLRLQLGFTLIELLVVLGAVAILAALAYPNYSNFVLRGKITEAHAGLFAKRVAMEQAFQDFHTYAGAAACNADSATSQYFTFSCSVQTATTYTIQAVGREAAAGFTFTVDQSNAKQTTAVPDGWSLPDPNTCWVTKRGGVC